jgi:5-oxoprolinase (ATP-hydrolysing)
MPVHLGSMSESSDRDPRNPDMQRGRRLRAERPYNGGTHLPDVTVVHAGLSRRRDRAPGFFVASRGHHADIGGITPGSMPPIFATTIEEEGVLIDNFKLVERGLRLRDCAKLRRCCKGPIPRATNQNLADLKAQIAANEKGAQELKAHGRAACSR